MPADRPAVSGDPSPTPTTPRTAAFVDWHVDCLRGLGLIEVARVTPDARHLRQGQNTKRYPTNVIAFRRP